MPQRFVDLGRPGRIWAVGAVHGQCRQLAAVHDDIAPRFHPGDRLVYLGNVLGYGVESARTVDELLLFRRTLLALPGMFPADVIYLRGRQEEMWQKLLQLQFAPNPGEIYRWMLQQGVAATIESYGGVVTEGWAAVRDGTIGLGKWTANLRRAIQARPGHDNIFTSLRRAAYTLPVPVSSREPGGSLGVLFVSAGLDAGRPLNAQGDELWWGGRDFEVLDRPYEGFGRVVRGFDPAGSGVRATDYTVTLDGGCGRGGSLVAACFSPSGALIEEVVH
jgi:hypothetical protein